jgi:uncharacterized membrane protein
MNIKLFLILILLLSALVYWLLPKTKFAKHLKMNENMKVRGTDNLYDEKQNYDMTRAAAISLPYSMVAMFLLYAMYKEVIFEGLVWFPIYVFFTLTVYSTSTLLYFKKD